MAQWIHEVQSLPNEITLAAHSEVGQIISLSDDTVDFLVRSLTVSNRSRSKLSVIFLTTPELLSLLGSEIAGRES